MFINWAQVQNEERWLCYLSFLCAGAHVTEELLEFAVGQMLRAQGLTIGLAESSTGGLVGHCITQVSGSSDYFVGSIVPYALDIQQRLVGVAPTTIEEHGVVSEPVAREMARGARRQLRADIGISVTGIASPHSGRSTKPIGLTYIGLAAEDVEACERHVFEGDRTENKQASAAAALGLLWRYLDRRAELLDLQHIVDSVDPESSPQLITVQRARAGILQPEQRNTQPRPEQSRRDAVRSKLGVLSSAFNPLTEAHIKMADLAMEDYELSEVMLELSKVNVDKQVYGASLAERLWMLKHVAAGRPALSVGLCSHARFIDKAEAIREVYPRDTDIYFIVGYDTLVRVFDPKYYTDLDAELRELFAESQFIAANRGEHDMADVVAFLEQPVCRPYIDRIKLIELDAHHARLSSTLVREHLEAEESIDGLVPEGIVPLISLTTLAG